MMQSGIELENSKFIHCCSCKSMTGLEIVRKIKSNLILKSEVSTLSLDRRLIVENDQVRPNPKRSLCFPKLPHMNMNLT